MANVLLKGFSIPNLRNIACLIGVTILIYCVLVLQSETEGLKKEEYMLENDNHVIYFNNKLDSEFYISGGEASIDGSIKNGNNDIQIIDDKDDVRVIEFIEEANEIPNNSQNQEMTNQKDKHVEIINNSEEYNNIEDYYPNMPIAFWKIVDENRENMYFKNKSCAKFPNIFDLHIDNTYWQTIHLENSTTAMLFSAYYDTRSVFSERDVKVLAMVNRTNDIFPGNKTYYCQLWYDNENEPVIVTINKVHYIWIEEWGLHWDGVLGPYLLVCSVPRTHYDKVPKVVSFVQNPCDNARNMLRISYDVPQKRKEFSVCVKGLDFFKSDISKRLVEWIEIMLLLGVDKIFMYQLNIHRNVKKVLDYYLKLGKVDVKLITLPNGNTNIPLLQHEFLARNLVVQCLDEIIPYNDCFYRNIYSYDYVAMLDIDEVIIPMKDTNLHDLIKRTMKYEDSGTIINGFTSRNLYFLDKMQEEGLYPDIPSHMHMLQHVYRAQNFSEPGEYVKTIFSTNYTITCHNHWPISTFPESIDLEFAVDDARLQHYRKDCPSEQDCDVVSKDPVKDTKLWEYKSSLIPKVQKVLTDLGLIRENG